MTFAGGPTGGRGVLALLADRTFGPFFFGKLLSSSGLWIQNLAAAVLMFELTHSAVMVGAVSGVQFLGPLVLALWAGALTDRVDRRMLLIAGRAIAGTAVGALAVVIAIWGRSGFGGAPVLLAVVLVTGVGLALSSPSMHALVPALVGDEDLEQALALNSAAPSLARALGPALGALLLIAGGPTLAFTVAALGHLAFVAALATIRARPHIREPGRPHLLGGLRHLRENKRVAVLIVGVAAIAFIGDPVLTLTPSLSQEMTGDTDLVGVWATTFGIGAVLATSTVRLMRRYLTLRVVAMVGFWISGGSLVLAALVSVPSLAAAAFLLCGAGFMLATVGLNTRLQRNIPDEVRGRVMALWSVAFLGTRPFAAMLNGSIAEVFSVRTALLISAVVVLASSLIARVRVR